MVTAIRRMVASLRPTHAPATVLPPGRILVIKLADLGDVLTVTPALRALRQTFPGSQIDGLVTPRSAAGLNGSTLIDELFTFDKFAFDRPKDALQPSHIREALRLGRELRRRKYDTVFLMHHLGTRWGRIKYAALVTTIGARQRVGLNNGHGWFLTISAPDLGYGIRHEVEYWLDVVAQVGARTEDTSLDLAVTESDRTYAQRLLTTATGWDSFVAPSEANSTVGSPAPEDPLVVIHPGSGGYSLARRWDVADFATVANTLMERHHSRIVIVGMVADGADQITQALRGPALDLTSRTTIGQLGAVLERAALFIGADSGVMHVAAATSTPIIAIFGPTNPRAWRPWCPHSPAVVLRSGPLCSPCGYVGFSVGQHNGCPERTCMRMVRPEQVLAIAEQLLARKALPGV